MLGPEDKAGNQAVLPLQGLRSPGNLYWEVKDTENGMSEMEREKCEAQGHSKPPWGGGLLAATLEVKRGGQELVMGGVQPLRVTTTS